MFTAGGIQVTQRVSQGEELVEMRGFLYARSFTQVGLERWEREIVCDV